MQQGSDQHAKERRAQRTRDALIELIEALSAAHDVSDVARVVLTIGKSLADADTGTVCLVSRDQRFLEIVSHVGFHDLGQLAPHMNMALTDDAPVTTATRTGQPFFFESLAELSLRFPRLAAPARARGRQADAFLPLMVRERRIGAITFGFIAPQRFDEEMRATLLTLARHCALATERALLLEDVQAREKRTRALIDVSTALSRCVAEGADEARIAEVLATRTHASLGWTCTLEVPAFGHVEFPRMMPLPPDSGGGRRKTVTVREGERELGRLTVDLGPGERVWDEDARLIDQLAERSALALAVCAHARALRHAQDDAIRASRAKDEFLALLGHELRNPLAPITTALDLLDARGKKGDAPERSILRRQVRHLTRMVDDLLDISRIVKGKIEVDPTPGELRSVLLRAVELAMPLLHERKQGLDVHAPAGLRVLVDEDRLAQAFSNLLINAARYTDPGGRITLEAFREDGYVVTAIRDTGIGMDAELLGRIFEPFEQGPRSTTFAGLGLGLAIVRSLVELHGGTVTATSEGPGRGSEFRLTLPALDDEDQRLATTDEHPVGIGLRVLAVDDNEDAVTLIARVLRSAGHTVVTTSSGAAAVELAPRMSPDVVLLDLAMPGLDGFEVAALLQEDPATRGSALIALTGYGQERDRERTKAAGFCAHLVKPVTAERLLVLLSEIERDRRPSSRP
ncbi:MAG: response regulator [Polyangiaceae bacterium]|nr:response regulator [Polyangiaceae bacterium]